MNKVKALFYAVLLTVSGSLYAVELSLEENKAESGTVGYVDIEKVFKIYPLTATSKQKFKDKIKEKQKFLDIKSAEIDEIKTKLIRLRQEKEFALSLKNIIESAETASQLAKEKAAEHRENKEAHISTFSAVEPSSQNISSGSVLSQEVKNTSSSVSFSTNTAGEKTAALSLPGVGNIPLSHFKFSVSTSPAEIEYAINSLGASLEAAYASRDDMKKQFDTEMMSNQEEETGKILGRIYVKLKELSIKEGVSVVVDKKSVLFGHKAVDLTDKLIKELKEDF